MVLLGESRNIRFSSAIVKGCVPGLASMAKAGALRVYAQKLGILTMESDSQMERNRSVAEIENFVHTQTLGNNLSPTCARCGPTMRFAEATAWLYGSDSGWIQSLPACVCDRDPVIGSDAISNASPPRASFMNLHFENVARRDC